MKKYTAVIFVATFYAVIGQFLYLNVITLFFPCYDVVIIDFRQESIMLFKTMSYFSLMGVLIFTVGHFFCRSKEIKLAKAALFHAANIFVNIMAFVFFMMIYGHKLCSNDFLISIGSVVSIARNNISLACMMIYATLVSLLLISLLSRYFKNK